MRRTLFCFIALIVALVIMQTRLVFDTNAQDALLYERLVSSSNPSHTKGNIKHLATQERGKTNKFLLLGKNIFPLKASLQSQYSTLRFHYNQESTSIEEEMEGCFGMIQSELFYQNKAGDKYSIGANGNIYLKGQIDNPIENTENLIPMQRVRTFSANKAIYNYQSNTLLANKVEVVDYLAQSHKLSWPLKNGQALLDGIGEDVKIKFTKEGPDFKAARLKLNLFSKRIL